MGSQQFETLNVLRLDVALPPEGLANLVRNPSGELGAWGWITPVAGQVLVAEPEKRLRFTVGASAAAPLLTELMPVIAGQFVAASFRLEEVTAGHSVRARFVWSDAAGTVLGSAAQTDAYSGVGTHVVTAEAAPVDAAAVQLRLDLYKAGGDPDAAASLAFHETTVAAADDADELVTVRRNLFPNPSFETNTASASPFAGCSLSRTAGGDQGAFELTITRTSGADGYVGAYLPALAGGFPVEKHRDYLVRASVRVGAGQPPSRAFLQAITTASKSFFADVTADEPTVIEAVVNTGDSATLRLTVGRDIAAIGSKLHVDAVMIELADTSGPYFDGDTPAAGDWTYGWSGTPHASTSTATINRLSYIEPVRWLNVLAPTHQIEVVRQELNAGALTATILDAALAPYEAEGIAPGRPCRLVTVDGELFFTGVARTAKVTFDNTAPLGKRARVEITATDSTTELSQHARSEGVATIAELPYVLEGCGVPWVVNGSSNQVPDATVVAVNDNATAVDQVVVTRDTERGYAWVDRAGVLQVWGAGLYVPDDALLADEQAYSGIDLSYDTERCINHVTIKFLRHNPSTGETEEVAYGPYVDQDSVRRWGVYAAEFTIATLGEDPVAIAAYAAQILLTNSTPTMRANSVTLPILAVSDLERPGRAAVDLYDPVRVVNAEAGYDQVQPVVGIRHTISPGSWTVELDLAGEGGAAAPQVTPSPSGGAGGKTLAQLLRPVGEVTMWFGVKADAPAGWLVCDGSGFDGDSYPDLATLLAGEVLPDFTDYVPIGAGTKALGASGLFGGAGASFAWRALYFLIRAR